MNEILINTNPFNRKEEKKPIYKECQNKECFCTGDCQDIVGYEYPDGKKEYIAQDLLIKPSSLLNLKTKKDTNCLHESCTECHGTGKKRGGEICVHFISCTCKKCNFTC
jgi:hypothetical protein